MLYKPIWHITLKTHHNFPSTFWMTQGSRLSLFSLPSTKSQTRLSDFTFTFHFHVLEKEMATHSSVLAWRIPGTEEPGGLPSMGSHRVGHDWCNLAAAAAYFLALLPYFCSSNLLFEAWSIENRLLLLLLLSCFSHVLLYVIPEMAAHQASPSLGFSRQEHWSGLPLFLVLTN